MDITDVRVSLRNEDRLKAFVTITFDDCFVVRGLKIIDGQDGLFVAMPSRRRPDGQFQDVAHPIHRRMRARLEESILAEYERVLAEGGEEIGSPHEAQAG